MTAPLAWVIWKGKASSNQGVILLNKRLNLPFTGALSLSFILQNTGTTRLGYILLVFSPIQCVHSEAWGIPIRQLHSSKWAKKKYNTGPASHLTSHVPSLDHLMWLGHLTWCKLTKMIKTHAGTSVMGYSRHQFLAEAVGPGLSCQGWCQYE